MKALKKLALSIAAATMITGCGEETKNEKKVEVSKFAPSLALSAKPASAVSVVEARAKLQKGGAVTIIGDIGGRVPPFVDNRAAFILADENNIVSCDKKHGDRCKKPWDYCCESPEKINTSIVVVQVLDDAEKVVKQSLKDWNGLKELSKVIVTGTYDETSTATNIIINATGIHIAK